MPDSWSSRSAAVLGLSFAVLVGFIVPLVLDVRAARHSTESPPWVAVAGIFTILLLWALLAAEALYVRLRKPGTGRAPIYTAKETSASLTVFAIQQVIGGLLLIAALACCSTSTIGRTTGWRSFGRTTPCTTPAKS